MEGILKGIPLSSEVVFERVKVGPWGGTSARLDCRLKARYHLIVMSKSQKSKIEQEMPFNNPLFSTHISPFLASTFLYSFVRYWLCLRQHFLPILQFIHMVLLLSSNQYNHFSIHLQFICSLFTDLFFPLQRSLSMCMKIMCRGYIDHLCKVVWVLTLCAHKILGKKMCVDLQASSFEWTISFVC